MRHNSVVDSAQIARLVAVLSTIAFVTVPPTGHAQTVQDATWLGGNGSWLDKTSWDVGVVPFNGNPNGAASYNVFIDGGKNDNATVTIPFATNNNLSYSFDNLTIDAGNTVTMPNGVLSIMGSVGAGIINNSGTFNVGVGGVNNVLPGGLNVFTALTLQGGGVLNLGVSPADNNSNTFVTTILGQPGSSLLNKDNIIQGFGGILINFTNQGTVNANVNGSYLQLATSNTVNTGTIEATNGGTLVFATGLGNIANAGGIIHAGNGSTVVIQGSVGSSNTTIVGGTLSTSGTGQIQLSSAAILDSVTISSGSTIQINGTPSVNDSEIRGTVVNNGTINVAGTTGNAAFLQVGDTSLSNPNTVTLSGGGTINLTSASSSISSPGNTLNNVSNTIQGQGIINATTLNNGGTLYANTAGTTLDVRGSGYSVNVTNTGTFQVAAGARLQIDTPLTNYNATTLTLSGGTYNVAGTLEITQGNDIRTNDASITINGANAEIEYFFQFAIHDALANLSLNAAGASLTFIDHNFTTAGNFTNNGTLIVDPSTFTVHANLVEGASSVLGAHIDGLTAGTQYDQFIVTGNASLAGTLDITFGPGFTPAIGESFALMTYASETGRFSSVDVTGLRSNLGYTLQYGPTGLMFDITGASVPEPGSISLLLTGGVILGLAAALRRSNGLPMSPDGA